MRGGVGPVALQQREEFVVEVAQGGIVEEQRFIDLGEALEDGRVGGEGFPLFDERADDPSTGSGQVKTLIFTASALLRTLAAISAPYSVKACGNAFENLSFWR